MNSYFQHAFKEHPSLIAAGLTGLIAVIVITPLCGLLFQCGCDWPWAGLDRNCNFHQPNAIRRCPWCVDIVVGVLAYASAIISGVFAAFYLRNPRSGRSDEQQILAQIVIRVVSGVIIFICVALISAVVAAFDQEYFAGVGRILL